MAIPSGYRFRVPFDDVAIGGTPFRPAVFEEMSVVPYVRDGWLSYTLWAKNMRSAPSTDNTPTRAHSRGGSVLSDPASDAA